MLFLKEFESWKFSCVRSFSLSHVSKNRFFFWRRKKKKHFKNKKHKCNTFVLQNIVMKQVNFYYV